MVATETCGGRAVSFLRVFAGLSWSCSRRRRLRRRFRSLAATAGRSRSLVRASLRLQLIARWQLRGASRVAALVHGGCRRALHECHMLCSLMRCVCTSFWVSLLEQIERGRRVLQNQQRSSLVPREASLGRTGRPWTRRAQLRQRDLLPAESQRSGQHDARRA
jgi:hypothetical protein